MGLYIVIAVEWIACLVVIVLIVRAVRRDDARWEARLQNVETSLEAKVAAAQAELAKAKAELPPDLVLKLELSDDDPLPDLSSAFKQTEPLVSALSQQEQSLGGAGLTLTAAKVEPGAVRLTLSPVDRIGSAERVRRVAEEWNARGGPLPPGVTSAHADVLAA
ncbi:MAG: hypothetical protein L0241_24695 [Planctomycetia bacterium]|nr:hypothetical protein [Planctomycetia bacterium]